MPPNSCGLPWWLSGKKIHLPIQEINVRSLGWEDPLEKEVATHFSILAWKIPYRERILVDYSPRCHKRVRHDLATKQQHGPIDVYYK